jgi:hypothetical protein
MPLYDCGNEDCLPCKTAFRQPAKPTTTGIDDVEWLDAKVCELSDRIDQLEAALKPFAEYGAVLHGQSTRGDTPLLELWDHKITCNDLRSAACAFPSLFHTPGKTTDD